MRAALITRFGDVDGIVLDDVPDPAPGPMQVLIQVRAAALNHLDLWVRRGLPGVRLPRIPGADAAGVVLETGPGVTRLRVGDRVVLDPGSSCRTCARCTSGEPSTCRQYGLLGEHRDGTHAEKIVVDAVQAVPMPAGLDFVQAASLPLTAMTAWRMLVVRGQLRPGERVFLHAGAAGVGVMALQIACAAGAVVVASASTPEKRQGLLALGAAAVVDSGAPDLAKQARGLGPEGGYDVVVDYVGKATWGTSLRLARTGGRVLTCGATTGHDPVEDLRHIFYRQVSIIGSTMGSRADLEACLQCVQDGRIRPVVGAVHALDRIRDAHLALESRAILGKVVLEMQG